MKFEIKNLDLEITNRCNAKCPACKRTGDFGAGVSEVMYNAGHKDISLDHIDMLLMHNKIKEWRYCGSFGDPIAHPKAFEIFEKVANYNAPIQKIITNGSMQNEKWWYNLGALPGKIRADFAIDGLEDTNHIYRINTSYNKIIKNAKAFMKGGGEANWVFIIFDYNEHQIEEARILSKELGFKSFNYVITSRHFNSKGNTSYVQNNIKIKAPKNKKYQSDIIKNGLLDKPIECIALKAKRIYVSPEGYLVPCCDTHSDVFYLDYNIINKVHYENSFKMFLDMCNIKYSLNEFSISEIISSYNNNLTNLEYMWKNRMLTTCNKRCGTNYINAAYSIDNE